MSGAALAASAGWAADVGGSPSPAESPSSAPARPAPTTRPARAVLLDVDGVLLDSTAALEGVWRTWARDRGLDPDEVWRRTPGRRSAETVRAVAPHLDPAVEQRVLDDLWRAVVDRVPTVPGATELLARLAGRPWAIVTSGSRWSVRRAFTANGLPLPAVWVCGEDVPAGKPAPDGYLRAAARLGVPAGDCVVVEDSPAGVAAGVAAGCHVVAVATTHPPSALRAAHVCVPSLRSALDLAVLR